MRGEQRAYVSTWRVLDWLATINAATPDGRHFLRRECNTGKRPKKSRLTTKVPTCILFLYLVNCDELFELRYYYAHKSKKLPNKQHAHINYYIFIQQS